MTTEIFPFDVHRETRHVEVEEVQRGAAFEGDPRLQERMAAERVEERHEPEDLLE